MNLTLPSNLSELSLNTSESSLSQPGSQPGIYICIQDFTQTDCIPCSIGDLIKVTQIFSNSQAIGFNLTSLQTGLIDLEYFIEMAPEMLIDLAKQSPKQTYTTPPKPIRKESINSAKTHCIQTDDLEATPSIYFIWKWPGKSVTIWGSFNDWARGIPLFYDPSTSIHVAFVETIETQGDTCIFKFYVDGEWRVDPELEQVVDEEDVFNTLKILVYTIQGDIVESEVDVAGEEVVRYLIPARLLQSKSEDDGDDRVLEKLVSQDTHAIQDIYTDEFQVDGQDNNVVQDTWSDEFQVDGKGTNIIRDNVSDESEVDVAKFDPLFTNDLQVTPKPFFVNHLDSESEYNQSPVDLIRFDEIIKVESSSGVEGVGQSLLDVAVIPADGHDTPELSSPVDVISYDEYVKDNLELEQKGAESFVIPTDEVLTSPQVDSNLDNDVITYEQLHEHHLDNDVITYDELVEQQKELDEADSKDVISFEELVRQQIDLDSKNCISSPVHVEDDQIITLDELVETQALIDEENQDLTTFDSVSSQNLGLNIFEKGTINFESLMTDYYLTSSPPRPVLQNIKTVLAHSPPVWENVQIKPRKRFSTFSSLESEDFSEIPLVNINSHTYSTNIMFLGLVIGLAGTRVWWDTVGYGVELVKGVLWCWIFLGMGYIFNLLLK